MWCAYAIEGRRRLFMEEDERFLSGNSHDSINGDDHSDSHFGGSPTIYSMNGASLLVTPDNLRMPLTQLISSYQKHYRS
jgi:hypothetical protein